jgi:hypothetical protein
MAPDQAMQERGLLNCPRRAWPSGREKWTKEERVATRIPLFLAIILVGILAVPAAHAVDTGIFTVCWHNNAENWYDSVFCWRTATQNGTWTYYKKGWTGDQNYGYALRWGASSLGDPKIVIDTNYYYIFSGKSVIGGTTYYSGWSSAVHYVHPGDNASVRLDIDNTYSPGNPNDQGGSRPIRP